MDVDCKIIKDRVYFYTPYNRQFVNDIQAVPTRKWDGISNANHVFLGSRKDVKHVLELVRKHFNVYVPFDLDECLKIPFGKATIDNDNVVLETTFDREFIADLKKTFMSCGWNGATWRIPVEHNPDLDRILNFITNWNVEYPATFIDDFNAIVKKFQEKLDLSKKLSIIGNAVTIPGIKCKLPINLKLYSFQDACFLFYELTNGLVLNADEMGLGKTIETLAWLYNHPEIRPILIICPAIVKLNWMEECIKWLDIPFINIHVVNGKKNKFIVPGKDIYITNFAIIACRLADLKKLGLKCIVVDEAHYMANYKAQRTIAIQALGKDVKHKICLTGTPILNRPRDLWEIIKFLGKSSLFGHVGKFLYRYCDARENELGYLDTAGASNLGELQAKLRSNFMIRRLKKNVLTQLPSKHRMRFVMNIDNEQEYKKAHYNFRQWLIDHQAEQLKEALKKLIDELKTTGFHTKGTIEKIKKLQSGGKLDYTTLMLIRIELLKQLVMKGKTKQILNFVDTLMDTEDKIIVFAHHKKLIREISEHLDSKGMTNRKIIGGMTAKQKQENINAFKNDSRAIMLCSLKAAGVGANLQTASTVVFCELGWTPAEHDQAEDRAHRIGQDKIVNIYYCIAKDTIEEEIWTLLEEKRQVIDATLNAGSIARSSNESVLEALVKKLKKPD